MDHHDEIRRRDLETIQRLEEDNKRLLKEKGCYGEACREKHLAEIDRLKRQVEGMRCSGNCEYIDYPEGGGYDCMLPGSDRNPPVCEKWKWRGE